MRRPAAPAAPDAEPPPAWGRALVVFGGGTDPWWLALLRPGFRHCFVVFDTAAGWILVNPMAHRTDLRPLDLPPGFDLAGWYRGQGCRVVVARPGCPPRRVAPWRPHTCVESVKRFLGVVDGRVFTPWQLYRHLAQKGKKSLTIPGAVGNHPLIPALTPSESAPPDPLIGAADRACREQNMINCQRKDIAMGGFFSSASSPAPVVVSAPVVDTTAEDEAAARESTLARNRRGLAATIATGAGGVLSPAQPAGKSLLGE